jgi:hypothetical protein
MPARTFTPALLLAVLLVLAAGCSLGGDDDEAAGTTTGTTVAQQSTAACRDSASTTEGTAIVASSLEVVREWKLDGSNLFPALGCLITDGQPVEGARIMVNNYLVPQATDENGGFYFPLDITRPQRAIARVADASEAQIDGSAASADEQRELEEAAGSLAVRFKLTELEAEPVAEGIRVTGRASYDDGSPPGVVVLYAYQLTGNIVDENGDPLEGAIVSTRSLDLELWSFSSPSEPDGTYRSFFLPSGDEVDKVGFTMRVAVGNDTWEVSPDQVVFFDKLKSATLELQIPPPGFPLVPDTPRAVPGAVFEGLLVGVTVEGEPVKPVSALWADDDGRFEIVLPSSVAGQTVRFWQSRLRAFSRTEARPGGEVDVDYWPDSIPEDAPRDLDALELPG